MKKEFERIYRAHGEQLRNFIYYKVGDLELAEDITHEAFIKLWKHIAKVSPTTAKSYLFTIANNLISDNYRKANVRYKFEQHKKNNQATVSNPEDIYREKEFKEMLETAISGLPEKQRVVFLMNRIDEMTYKEIAKSLEISPKTVEKRMHGALVALRKLYAKI